VGDRPEGGEGERLPANWKCTQKLVLTDDDQKANKKYESERRGLYDFTDHKTVK
jgi:hypothetical protein